ncbi:uncharacterized protein MYCFIDRAFT_170552 [Pseudocercospora fijiensis CIRAD86]|uniref:Uncharacterized protein n=1 Tax=Pseudocercospora fijiensis (strain CIRAD86) TaxID=383855 RepID=N1QC77_PSEFD|nr:uncharacterized protein MYCFIDRAFT_170552 [Pseudocercospora fijiensis CIRAD86]EME89017.1 hypothetical protein MYCFIDRAFT_170552 [Pseudocercospora fijiensis CIRAD86]
MFLLHLTKFSASKVSFTVTCKVMFVAVKCIQRPVVARHGACYACGMHGRFKSSLALTWAKYQVAVTTRTHFRRTSLSPPPPRARPLTTPLLLTSQRL